MEKAGTTVAFATFNGRHSSKMSWMSVDRVTSYYWNDVAIKCYMVFKIYMFPVVFANFDKGFSYH